MRFVCDQMLAKVGKWLRAAGYDTLVVGISLPDRDILNMAISENRLLITRDRHFLEMKEGKGFVIWLKSNKTKDCIKELNKKISIDWLYRPFSRCLDCNFELEPVDIKDRDDVPEEVAKTFTQFFTCPICKKTFWLGSHTDRMLETLKKI